MQIQILRCDIQGRGKHNNIRSTQNWLNLWNVYLIFLPDFCVMKKLKHACLIYECLKKINFLSRAFLLSHAQDVHLSQVYERIMQKYFTFAKYHAGKEILRYKNSHTPINYRTCTPAEAEPILKSSSCYPLVHFKRPFCQNHGIVLSNYVYNTPANQDRRNHDINSNYDRVMKMDVIQISSFFKVNVTTVKKCIKALSLLFCHFYFPRCDGTQSVYRRQYICRESCLELTHICGNIWKMLERYFLLQFPKMAKLVNCELQPYRNAGDSPECWYYNEFSNSTGNVLEK